MGQWWYVNRAIWCRRRARVCLSLLSAGRARFGRCASQVVIRGARASRSVWAAGVIVLLCCSLLYGCYVNVYYDAPGFSQQQVFPSNGFFLHTRSKPRFCGVVFAPLNLIDAFKKNENGSMVSMFSLTGDSCTGSQIDTGVGIRTGRVSSR